MAKRYYNSNNKGMISEDMSKPAGMPQDVVMKDFPPCPYGGSGYEYGDSLESADSQMKDDLKFFNRKKKPGKW